MRELTSNEIGCVTGGTGVCTPDGTGGPDAEDNFLGGQKPGSGSDMTKVYTALVDATSRLIERVANAFGD